MMNDERWIFDFIAPIHGSKIWRHRHMVVGGWEISGSGEKNLIKTAMQLLKREEIRLQKLLDKEEAFRGEGYCTPIDHRALRNGGILSCPKCGDSTQEALRGGGVGE